MGRLSLVQQIAELEVTAPTEFDIEDNVPELHADDAGATEHYVDVGPSSLRRAQDTISDPKYSGVKISRREMYADSDSTGDHDAEDSEVLDADDTQAVDKVSSDLEIEEAVPSQVQPAEQDEVTSALQKSRQADRLKGKAIIRQKDIWDTLLDARIRIQKAATAMNKLPADNDYDEESLRSMLQQVALLSEDLFDLQEHLSDSMSPPPRKRRKIQPEKNSLKELQTYVQDAIQDSSALEHACHPYLIQTLSKWSSKIQAVAPSLLLPSNKNTFSRGNQRQKSVVELIDENLLDHSKLLARTQTWKNDENEGKPEAVHNIFDDSDFYHQLLRDVIDNQANGKEEWMLMQKQKKAKKKVDTKASKGRKIRYEIHEKLQNFMVPIPVAGGWQDEQIDELFSSLLGKGFEHVLGPEPVPSNELDNETAGFRVF